MTLAHSFDVFDTLLVRTRARPVDVVHAAAEIAAPGSGGEPGRAELVSELSRRRRGADVQARKRLALDAVGLDEVYAELDDLRALGVDPADLHRAELAVEEDEVRPVLAGREAVEAARAAGRKVVFVSDMYLPPAQIRGALERFGIAQPDDPLYVSGELGASKRSGRLFDHVLRAEGLSPADLVHTGDDPITDLASPARRGIAVEPLTGARLNRFEREVLSRSSAPRDVAARLTGISRAARVAHAPGRGDGAHAAAVGADIAGPLFASFVAWTLRGAREEGIERLYFVSRDAQILLRVAHELARPGDPECRYLYGSRQAWLLAGVDSVDRESLHWLLEPEWDAPRALLAKLAIEPEEVAGELRAHGLGPDDRPTEASLERFWALVGEIAPLILERAAQARERAAAYFEQEGLRGEGSWALVDLGWRLTTQRALRRILAGERDGGDPFGFYLAIRSRRARLAEVGRFRAFVLEDDEPDAGYLPESWIWNNVSLIEQVFAMADHGYCTGYRRENGRVVPVLAALTRDAGRVALRSRLQAAVVECARELGRSGLLEEHLADARAAGLIAGRLAVEEPRRDEAASLAWVRVTDDQNETRSRPLAEPLALGDVWRRAQDKLGRDVVQDFDTVSRWREGSLALTPPVTRTVFHGLRMAGLAAARGRAQVARLPGYRRWRRFRS